MTMTINIYAVDSRKTHYAERIEVVDEFAARREGQFWADEWNRDVWIYEVGDRDPLMRVSPVADGLQE